MGSSTSSSSPARQDINRPSRNVDLLYWNAFLSVIALVFHCIPFAAFEFIDDGGATGLRLFGFAPVALILTMFVCLPGLFVQFILLFIAFSKQWPLRYHRLYAFAITVTGIALIFVAGSFGWLIHV